MNVIIRMLCRKFFAKKQLSYSIKPISALIVLTLQKNSASFQYTMNRRKHAGPLFKTPTHPRHNLNELFSRVYVKTCSLSLWSMARSIVALRLAPCNI